MQTLLIMVRRAFAALAVFGLLIAPLSSSGAMQMRAAPMHDDGAAAPSHLACCAGDCTDPDNMPSSCPAAVICLGYDIPAQAAVAVLPNPPLDLDAVPLRDEAGRQAISHSPPTPPPKA